MDIKTALLDFGLKEKEADVYLALLQIGPSSAQEITKKTGIIRQTVYDILDKLQATGLVSLTSQNTISIFTAKEPKSLVKILDQKKRAVSSVLHQLESLQEADNTIVTTQFRGLKGLKLLYDDFLDAKNEILTIQPEIPEQILKEYFISNFLQKRIEYKIPIRILKRDIVTDFQKKIVSNKKEFREVRLLTKLQDIQDHVVIYDNNLIFIDYQNLVGVKITHGMFIHSQKQIFELLWEISSQV